MPILPVKYFLDEIHTRLGQLLTAGWQKVRVITDHGWLLFPGGLPSIKLPKPLTQIRWGRCALVKTGAKSEEKLYPWYWNREQYIALAPGIYCYRGGSEYDHGGLSFQESLTLELEITSSPTHRKRAGVRIKTITWRGFRCTVTAAGDTRGIYLEIRSHAGNPNSRLSQKTKPLDEQGKGSVVIEKDEFEGQKVYILLVEKKGQLIAQEETVIGGGE